MNFRRIMPIILCSSFLLGGCELSQQLEDYMKTTILPHAGISPSNEHLEQLQLEDGRYYASADEFSTTTGFKEFVSFDVVDHKITTIQFDAVHQTAQKTQKEHSQTKPNESSELPDHEQLKLLETYVKDNPAITPDTFTADQLKTLTLDALPYLTLYVNALNNGPIEAGSYQDGHYFATIDDFVDGQKPVMYLTIFNGHIVAVNYDTLLQDETKTLKQLAAENDDQEHQEWSDQVNELEHYLIEIQNPSQIKATEENTIVGIDGTYPFVHEFIELSIKALAAGPLIE